MLKRIGARTFLDIDDGLVKLTLRNEHVQLVREVSEPPHVGGREHVLAAGRFGALVDAKVDGRRLDVRDEIKFKSC